MPAILIKVQPNYVWTGKMLATSFNSNSECSESSHLNKSILMRERTVFQMSSTRLKETEFLKSLVATTNIAAWLGNSKTANSSFLSLGIEQQHNTIRSKHIHCLGLTSSIAFRYDGITQGHRESLLRRQWQIVRSQLNLWLLLCKTDVDIRMGRWPLTMQIWMVGASLASDWLGMVTSLYCRGSTGYNTRDRDNTQHRPGQCN